MIHHDNKRVCITMTQKKAKWLEDLANEMNMSISQMANLLISKNIKIIASLLDINHWEKLQQIVKTKWLDNEPY